jgi:hypothetical protein
MSETLLHTLPAFIDVGEIEMIARVVTENVDVHTQADRFHRLQLERRHARESCIENIEADPGREARIELAPEVALTSLEIFVESLRGPVLREPRTRHRWLVLKTKWGTYSTSKGLSSS